jgi:hypothetical protein
LGNFFREEWRGGEKGEGGGGGRREKGEGRREEGEGGRRDWGDNLLVQVAHYPQWESQLLK